MLYFFFIGNISTEIRALFFRSVGNFATFIANKVHPFSHSIYIYIFNNRRRAVEGICFDESHPHGHPHR